MRLWSNSRAPIEFASYHLGPRRGWVGHEITGRRYVYRGCQPFYLGAARCFERGAGEQDTGVPRRSGEHAWPAIRPILTFRYVFHVALYRRLSRLDREVV